MQAMVEIQSVRNPVGFPSLPGTESGFFGEEGGVKKIGCLKPI